jgi:hypothetical protein
VEEGEQIAWGSGVSRRRRCGLGEGASGGVMEGLIGKVVEVQTSGSLEPALEVPVLRSICARFCNPILSCQV